MKKYKFQNLTELISFTAIFLFIILVYSCKKDQVSNPRSDRRIYILDSETKEGIKDAEVEVFRVIVSNGVVAKVILIGSGKTNHDGIYILPDSINPSEGNFRVYASHQSYNSMDVSENLFFHPQDQKYRVYLDPLGYLKIHVKKISPPSFKRVLNLENIRAYSGRDYFTADQVDEYMIARRVTNPQFRLSYTINDSISRTSFDTILPISRFDTTYLSIQY